MDVDVAAARLATCEGCDRLFRPTMSCKACGCFVKIKARISSQTCPLGKWEQT